jgi:flagellar assembly protein FliH
LPPVDVDSFFIEYERIEQDYKNSITKTTVNESETEAVSDQDDGKTSDDHSAEETTLESTEEEDNNDREESEIAADEVAVAINAADRKRLESVLLEFEDKPKPKPKFNVQPEKPRVEPMELEQTLANHFDPEVINLDHLAEVAANIESLFSGAKEQAGAIADEAQLHAGSIIDGASKRAGEALEQAKQRANEITFGAEHKAGSIMGQASQQSDTIISLAKDQANLIIEGAQQKAEKSIEKTKHQAGVIVENANKEAARIIEDTQKQIVTLLAEANEQSKTIKEQAHQDGLAAGRSDAITVVRKELSDNLTQALTLINEIETERMQRLTSSEPELIKLAVSIAEKIIGEEIELDPVRQLRIIGEALARVTTANMLTIRIHSDDLQVVQDNLALLQSSFSEPKPIKVEEDCNITKGSCFIETDQGNLDARIKSQLDRIMAELLKVGRIE